MFFNGMRLLDFPTTYKLVGQKSSIYLECKPADEGGK